MTWRAKIYYDGEIAFDSGAPDLGQLHGSINSYVRAAKRADTLAKLDPNELEAAADTLRALAGAIRT